MSIPRRSRVSRLDRLLATIGALLAALLLFACTPAVEPASQIRAPNDPARPTVIAISLDGVRFDALDRSDLPSFARVRSRGASASRLLPPFPSLTFPSHVTLATGAPADVHGIVANRFYDRARGEEFDYGADAGWIDAEPIWSAAERQGVRAAVFFWVGSETDWRGIGATHRMTPFSSRVPERKKVDQMLAWLDLPPRERPQLVMAWWHGADHAGHEHGPGSPEVASALREQDAQLGRLLAGLDARAAWSSTTLVIVSDHGMLAAGEAVDLKKVLRAAGIRARVVPSGAVAHVHLDDRSPAEIERAVAALRSVDGVAAFARDDLPDQLRYAHPSRVGDVVALADATRVITSSRTPAPGMHGYDVESVPEMAGVFLAVGRGVEPGRSLGDVRSLDVAATLASLLGIDPPQQSEGRAVELAGP